MVVHDKVAVVHDIGVEKGKHERYYNYREHVQGELVWRYIKQYHVFSLWLGGCTTQSIEDAKNIVETKTYAYRYEYETEQNGEAITQYHEEKPTNTDYVEDTEENILYLQSKASMLKFMKMNETFTNGDCEYKVTDVIATTYRDYAYELVNDEYTEGMMDYLKKIRNVDDNGYLTDKEYRFIWVNIMEGHQPN